MRTSWPWPLALGLIAVAAACGPTRPAATATPPPAATPSAAPTPAATANQTTAPIALTVIACADSTKQLCDPPAAITVWTEGALVVDVTASPSHCSSMIAHVSLDGREAFVSNALAPGEATGPRDLGPVAPGAHRLEIRAEGVLGGCNSGGVGNWSGTVELGITAGAAPYPTPRQETPGP